jgi:hypothetical protein
VTREVAEVDDVGAQRLRARLSAAGLRAVDGDATGHCMFDASAVQLNEQGEPSDIWCQSSVTSSVRALMHKMQGARSALAIILVPSLVG